MSSKRRVVRSRGRTCRRQSLHHIALHPSMPPAPTPHLDGCWRGTRAFGAGSSLEWSYCALANCSRSRRTCHIHTVQGRARAPIILEHARHLMAKRLLAPSVAASAPLPRLVVVRHVPRPALAMLLPPSPPPPQLSPPPPLSPAIFRPLSPPPPCAPRMQALERFARASHNRACRSSRHSPLAPQQCARTARASRAPNRREPPAQMWETSEANVQGPPPVGARSTHVEGHWRVGLVHSIDAQQTGSAHKLGVHRTDLQCGNA